MKRFVPHAVRLMLAGAMIVALSASVFAQINRQISYQGYLAQPNGSPLADGQYSMVLRLYDAATGGNLVWEETQTTTIAKGLFNVYLGSVQTLDNVDFSKQMYLETALAGQPAFQRTQLAQVPYAIYAGRAGSAASLDTTATGFVRSLNGGQGNLVVKGQDGIVVNREGDTITIQSTVTFSGIQSLTSPQGTIDIVGESGPNATIDVKDGAITSAKIADNAVTNVKIASGAITANKIAVGVIPTTLPPSGSAGGDLSGTYPNPLLANGAVTTAKIADNTITTPKLTDGVVTMPKISDGSISTSKIADGAVTSQKLSATGVSAGTFGDVLNIPRITVDPQGRITGISNTSIANFPYIVGAGGDLTGTYPDPIIRNNAITTAKILDGSITTAKLVDQSVTNVKIADNAVNSAKIQDFTIVNQDIAPGVIPSVLPPIGPAGGDLIGSSYPNPVIAPGVVTPSKVQPMLPGRFVIGTGTGTSAAVGAIVAGTGMTVQYNNPNIVLSTSTVINPGFANDNTLRWDAASLAWVPNTNVLASSSGNLQVNGTLSVLGNGGQSLFFGPVNMTSNLAVDGTVTLGASAQQAVNMFAGTVAMPNIPSNSVSGNFVVSNGGALQTRNDVVTAFFGGGVSGKTTRWVNATTIGNGSFDDNGAGTLSFPGSFSLNPGAGNSIISDGSLNMNGSGNFAGGLSTGGTLGVTGTATMFGNTVLGDNSADAVTINAATLTAPNLPSGSTSTEFVVRSSNALQTRTINNITTGTGTFGRMARWGVGNALVDASLDDNGNGTLTRSGAINISSTGNDVIIENTFRVSGRDAFIGDEFGGSLSIREFGGNFNGRILVDNLGFTNRDYIIPSSNVSTTYFLLRDFGGTQTVNSALQFNSALTLMSGTTDYQSNVVDAANRSNTYIAFAEAGTVNDWAYLRQIGGPNDFHLALDFHDDVNDARFSIRSIASSNPNPTDPAAVTRLALDDQGRFMIGAENATVPFFFQASGALDNLESPAETDAASLYVFNSNSQDPNAHAINVIRSAGSNGGDAYLSLDVKDESGYSFGVDNSDGNKLKIVDTWDFTGTALMTIDRSAPSVDFAAPTTVAQTLTVNRFNGNEGGQINFQYGADPTKYFIIDQYNGTEESRLRLFAATPGELSGICIEEDDGHVGIGTKDPSYKFEVQTDEATTARLVSNAADVNGLLRIEATTTDNAPHEMIWFAKGGVERGKIMVDATNTLSYQTTSDYRLKTDLRSFSGLSLVNKIAVYDYKWKDSDGRMYGFMAHEIQDVLPGVVSGAKDAVDANGKPQYQMVDYSKLTPVLTKAIQEQQALIEKQQTMINDQQERLEKLEALVKELLEKK